MNTMVFRCPGCLQPFQVMAEQAGQMVRCPGCQTTVQIPAMAPAPTSPQQPPYIPPAPAEGPQEPDFDFTNRSRGVPQLPAFEVPADENVQRDPAVQRQPAPPAETAEPYDCPECSQAFGIYPSMMGTQMLCPHCESMVLLRSKLERPAPKESAPNNAARSKVRKSLKPVEPDRSKPVEPDRSTSKRSESSTPHSASPGVASDSSQVRDDQRDEIAQKESSSEKIKHSRSERRKASREAKSAPRPGKFRSVEDLLPPKFRAIDPDFFYRRHQDGAHVLLPSSDGEVKVVDNRIVKIEHNGETYELISSPEYDRVQKAIVTNVLAVLICGLIIAIVMTLLNG